MSTLSIKRPDDLLGETGDMRAMGSGLTAILQYYGRGPGAPRPSGGDDENDTQTDSGEKRSVEDFGASFRRIAAAAALQAAGEQNDGSDLPPTKRLVVDADLPPTARTTSDREGSVRDRGFVFDLSKMAMEALSSRDIRFSDFLRNLFRGTISDVVGRITPDPSGEAWLWFRGSDTACRCDFEGVIVVDEPFEARFVFASGENVVCEFMIPTSVEDGERFFSGVISLNFPNVNSVKLSFIRSK